MKRRHFLQVSALAGGSLLLRGQLDLALAEPAAGPLAGPAAGPLAGPAAGPAAGPTTGSAAVALNAWLRIQPSNVTTILLSQAEMGQGVQTTLPAIIADELGADWSLVEVENAPADPAYRNPRSNWQFTGNAESVRSFFGLLRQMGAAGREMLIAAAARRWRVPVAQCAAERSHVVHARSGRRLSFGELARDAAALPVPASPRLKSPAEWTLLGQALPRRDIPAKATGTAVFGIDLELDGMAHAAVTLCPVFGGDVDTVDESSVTAMPGVLGVVRIPGGVAVVAETYWQARRALDRLSVTWNEGPHAGLSSATLDQTYRETLAGERWTAVVDEGDAPAAIAAARARGERVVSAEYSSTWQSHAPMEPMNCTARVTDGGCEIWGPTQGQEMAQIKVAAALGIPRERVRVERTYLGGGFGRRLIADYAVQAALVARAAGRPVKILWSREEELRHGPYRPRVLHRLEAALGSDGQPAALAQKLVTPTILSAVIGSGKVFRFPEVDPSCVEGLRHMRYALPRARLDLHLLDVPIPTMVWRTTGYGPNVFALECFVDELAHAAGQDPYEYRRALLLAHADNQRALGVLDRVTREAGWTEPRPGRHQGLAFAHAYDSYIAQVVEISLPAPDTIEIHRVVSAVDCGHVLDPRIASSVIEGGVVWGLSQALISEITFERGRAVQSNFDDYRLLALPETPRTEVHFIDSQAAPGGLGELGPITVTPALCNAIFAATGKRYRTLPLSRHGVYTRYARQFV
jgi:isoquinoline 1-oxidoreductase beta subunit